MPGCDSQHGPAQETEQERQHKNIETERAVGKWPGTDASCRDRGVSEGANTEKSAHTPRKQQQRCCSSSPK